MKKFIVHIEWEKEEIEVEAERISEAIEKAKELVNMCPNIDDAFVINNRGKIDRGR